MAPDFVRRVITRALLWLPVCLALWYWAGHWFAEPAFWLAREVLLTQFSNFVADVQMTGHEVNVTTRVYLAQRVDGVAKLQPALKYHVDALYYCYGQPLLMALLLASGRHKLFSGLALGLLMLVPFQAWGIVFAVLKFLADVLGTAIMAQIGVEGWYWRKTIVILGYQMGNLLFPSLVPIVVWLGFNRQTIWPNETPRQSN
jgi:hypothetical protein